MKKIIGLAAATVAVLAIAIGYQAISAPTNVDLKDPPAATSTETPDPTTPPDGATVGPGAATTSDKTDDGEREGFTEDNTGKPGENKN